jgi:hypothetical protein
MSTPRALPTLFGRYSLVLSEHSNLETTWERLNDIARRFGTHNVMPSQELALSELLSDLRANLERHFQAEESQDYFGALVAERPALAPRVAALQHQHRAMLATLDALRLLAFEARAWGQFKSTVSVLIKTFHTHERSESLLIHGFLAGEDKTA